MNQTLSIQTIQNQFALLKKSIDALTYTSPDNILENRLQPFSLFSGEDLPMRGKIRTREICIDCGGKFKDFGQILACENCLLQGKISIPKRLYIDIYHHKKYKLYSDNDGEPLASYERAKRLLIEINQKIRKPNYVFNPSDYVARDCRKLQFGKYIQDWYGRYEIEYKNGTKSLSILRTLKGFIKNYYIPFFKNRDIREIFEGDIEDFCLSLPEKMKISSKKQIMACLVKLFNDAKRRKDIKSAPEFPKISVEDPKTVWLDEETQDLIYQHIPDKDKPIFLFMMRQGVRPGEARAVHWEDIDWKNKTVNIHRTFFQQYLKTKTKTKSNRTIPLDPDVFCILSKRRGISGLIFLIDGQRHYSAKILNYTWNKAVNMAGVEHITLYCGTRHSVASQAINRGVSREQVGTFLGHVNYATTKRYLHMNTEGLRPVLRAEIKKMRPKSEAQLRPK